MDINMHGTTGTIRFLWDMNQKSIDTMYAPLPSNPIDVSDYMGAVFFGKYKLEFILNDIAGVYCNLFEYGAEDDPGHAYEYLEDGTPYEERYPVSDEIVKPDDRTFTDFAADVERQIVLMLDRHPEFIPSALEYVDPNSWYPCNHPYKVTVTRES